MQNIRSTFATLLLVVIAWMGGEAAHAQDQVLEKLRALPGVTVLEKTSANDTTVGLRRFELQITQPVDHFNPGSGTFQQKLILFHRDFAEPMVLQTSGYKIFVERLSRIAATFQTNQIQVEHRFFDQSSPEPKDWSKLTVAQSAEDFHRIVATFKTLYPGHWVNTGASKGGMTSIFFRRFFPDDLDGTVADVAPTSFTTEDPRYIDFVDHAGGPKYSQCRADLESLQRTFLNRRGEVLPLIEGEYSILGGKEASYEHSVLEMTFAFWQYGNPEDPDFGCAKIPGEKSSPEELQKFLVEINDINSYSDSELLSFQPYYYQAAAELGAPATKLSFVADLLKFPYSLQMYLPQGQPVVYTDVTQKDVNDWVARSAKSVMFVYGEFDPWSAGAYRSINGSTDADNHWYEVPGGNHGSNFGLLPTAAKSEATAVIARWLNKSPPSPAPFRSRTVEFLEDAEFKALRRLRGVRP